MIQLNTVAKHYSEAVHIGPVSLELPRGGITALVGPNGAGKSTLLTMIGRLLGIDEGTITVGGADVSTTKSKELAKILSILRQENHFVSRLTVRQLVPFEEGSKLNDQSTSTDQVVECMTVGEHVKCSPTVICMLLMRNASKKIQRPIPRLLKVASPCWSVVT